MSRPSTSAMLLLGAIAAVLALPLISGAAAAVEPNTSRNRRRRLPLGHLPEPAVRWETRLPGAGPGGSGGSGGGGKPGPRRHNAVRLSPDQTHLYVTLDDGALHILDADNGDDGGGRVVASYRPPSVSDRGITCASGVSFSDSSGGASDDAFAVYAVLDVPTDGATATPTTSRVVAIDHPTGQVRWISPVLEGTVAGTPQVGSDGRYIYLTRNVEVNDQQGMRQDGHFTLLDAQSGGTVAYTQPSSAYRGGNETGPYAPLELVHRPFSGNFGEGEGSANRNDVAAWAQSSGGGMNLNGMSLAFQFPSSNTGNSSAWSPYLLKVNGWGTATRPTLSSDGQNLYFTASKASLRGWNTRFGRRASWKAEQLDANPANSRAALAAAATLSIDERSLFVASGSDSFYSLDAYTGLTNWRVESGAPFYAEARVSPDGRRVFSIEHTSGRITSRDAETGQEYWSVNCGTYDTANPFCTYNVEAEFDLSDDGYTLYYADVLGLVRALTVGYDAPPSPAPTRVPTPRPMEADPTREPSAEPTPEPTTDQTEDPTRRPTEPPTPEARDNQPLDNEPPDNGPPSGASRLLSSSPTLLGMLSATVGFVLAFALI
mmetsp:Transcript_12430/g.29385  ORF Transcript_12430/g.29385 Transcript_12430/m.29385 type:complete len:602 (+) Transcript_12430:242-2047(+)